MSEKEKEREEVKERAWYFLLYKFLTRKKERIEFICFILICITLLIVLNLFTWYSLSIEGFILVIEFELFLIILVTLTMYKQYIGLIWCVIGTIVLLISISLYV